MMQLKWYGHASFKITASNGTSIITDPYTPETSGYKPITESADIVIMSSDNDSFHCRADLIDGNPKVINALELARSGAPQTVNGIEFHAIEAMEALNHPTHDPDQNGMYRFEVDGISIGHMGDAGNPLTEQQMQFFDGVNILLALTGGYPTIELEDLDELIHFAKPQIVVPMHFRTLRCKLNKILWIQSFLSYYDNRLVDFVYDSETQLTKDDLPDSTRVLVLDYV